MNDVLGIGNALVDILASVNDTFLDEHDLNKSTMHLTENDKQELILRDLKKTTIASGGSVANTIATLGQLGCDAAFIGQITDDKWGVFFEQDMQDLGIETKLNILKSDEERVSGTSVILITPDGERTMNTNLGVSSLINKSCLDNDIINNSKMLYLEGYLYDSLEAKETINLSVLMAIKQSSKIALSLSDAFCVDRHRVAFKDLISNIDILLANESEICSLFEIDNQHLNIEMISEFKNELPPMVAITQSERGATIIENNEIFCIPTVPVISPIDLTGAGDQFAAGFLFGLINGFNSKKSGDIGIHLALEIISRIGPRFATDEIIKTS